MGERRTVDAIYDLVRRAMPSGGVEVPAAGDPVPITSQIRVLALRTPTLPPAAHTNVYLVGPSDGPIVVVDPGSPYPEEIDRLAAATGLRCAAILLTHHHGDHIGGAVALAERTGAPILAHAETAAVLDGIVRIDRELADGEVYAGITAIHTPGHARGHLCFELDGATIAGDMVAGIGTILIDPDEGDMAIYLASLAKLLARPATQLLPAHGPMISDGHAKLREYIAHRTMREAKVMAAIAAHPHATATELVPHAYADTPAMLWFLAERSLLAHVGKLCAEGRAVATVSDEIRYSPAP